MMRLRKIVKIDDREVTVYELRIKDIQELLSRVDRVADDSTNIMEIISKFLPLACDLDKQALEELAPSEIKLLTDAFQEVNAVFLNALKSMGLFDQIKRGILSDLSAPFASSSNEVTH